jgi:hypothetical protein
MLSHKKKRLTFVNRLLRSEADSKCWAKPELAGMPISADRKVEQEILSIPATAILKVSNALYRRGDVLRQNCVAGTKSDILAVLAPISLSLLVLLQRMLSQKKSD